MAGEWRFAWVLRGAACRDVLYAAGAQPGERGTTLRGRDERDLWHVVCMRPHAGELLALDARGDDAAIAREGDGPGVWTF